MSWHGMKTKKYNDQLFNELQPPPRSGKLLAALLASADRELGVLRDHYNQCNDQVVAVPSNERS